MFVLFLTQQYFLHCTSISSFLGGGGDYAGYDSYPIQEKRGQWAQAIDDGGVGVVCAARVETRRRFRVDSPREDNQAQSIQRTGGARGKGVWIDWLIDCCCCCCCLHIKSRSDLYSVLYNIRTGPTDANAFCGHRLTTQKGYTLWKKSQGNKRTQKSQHTRDNWKRKEKKRNPEK